MNSGLLKLFVLIMLLGTTVTNQTPTFYVNGNSGDDANIGLSASPWPTLSQAVSQAVSGDIIMVAGTITEINVSIDP